MSARARAWRPAASEKSPRAPAHPLEAQARELDLALAARIGLRQIANPERGLSLLVKHTAENRAALHSTLDEKLRQLEARQHNALRQHMQYVAELIRRLDRASSEGALPSSDAARPCLREMELNGVLGGHEQEGLAGLADFACTDSAPTRPASLRKRSSSPRQPSTFSSRKDTSRKDKGNKMKGWLSSKEPRPPSLGSRARFSASPSPDRPADARGSQMVQTDLPLLLEGELMREISEFRCAVEAGMQRLMEMKAPDVMPTAGEITASVSASAVPVAAADEEKAQQSDAAGQKDRKKSGNRLMRAISQLTLGGPHHHQHHQHQQPPQTSPNPSFGTASLSGPDNSLDWRRQTEKSQDVRFRQSVANAAKALADRVDKSGPRMLKSPLDAFVAVMTTQEPKRRGSLARMVGSSQFEVFCCFVILMNVGLTIFFQEKELNSIQAGHSWEGSKTALIVETCFLGWYVLELTMKLIVHRAYFFLNDDYCWNIFDTSLVLLGVTDCVFSWYAATLFEAGSSVPVELRVLRIARVGRILRAMRAVRVLEELRVMMQLVLASFDSFFWALLMVTLFTSMLGLFLMNGLVVAAAADPEGLANLEFFTGFLQACLCILQSGTGGVDWRDPFEELFLIGSVYAYMFVGYLLFFILVLLNVITSVFLNTVMKLWEPSAEAMVAERTKIEEHDMDELRKMMSKLKGSSDTTISKSEFLQAVSQKEFGAFLAARGIDIKEARAFFALLMESTEHSATNMSEQQVDVQEMVRACVRLKGAASSVDLQILRHELREFQRNVYACMHSSAGVAASHGAAPHQPATHQLATQEFVTPFQLGN